MTDGDMDVRYYDVQRHWTKRIEPHLGDEKLNAILVRDFNKFTWGRWRQKFTIGMVPRDFESCDWSCEHIGPEPRFWRYVKHSACHWLVNFNLRLAQLVEPDRPWRIVTSDEHSTVFDGETTLFDLNFLALDIPPEECLAAAILPLANGRELPIGKELRCYVVEHWRTTQAREEREQKAAV